MVDIIKKENIYSYSENICSCLRGENMGRKAYKKEPIEKEKGEMKQLLWNWGVALERFEWKEEELKNMTELYERQKAVWERGYSEQAAEELDRIEKEYRKQAGGLRIEMVEILREKGKVDEWIRRLTLDEQNLVQMRFEKGHSMEYIGMKMHLSRATVFRMQNRMLSKLIEMQKSSGKN